MSLVRMQQLPGVDMDAVAGCIITMNDKVWVEVTDEIHAVGRSSRCFVRGDNIPVIAIFSPVKIARTTEFTTGWDVHQLDDYNLLVRNVSSKRAFQLKSTRLLVAYLWAPSDKADVHELPLDRVPIVYETVSDMPGARFACVDISKLSD